MGKRHKVRKVGKLPPSEGFRAARQKPSGSAVRPVRPVAVGPVRRSWACPDRRYVLRFAVAA